MTGDVSLASPQRRVVRVVPSEEAMEGGGVRIRRAIGTEELPDVDPFLLLDEIHSNEPSAYLAGFPSHPHRGLETVTYMLSGEMRHRDSTGGTGVISGGDVQWMTAGRGIIHSEMPGQEDGLMWGFQLWVNMPAAEKMTPAGYLELKAESIPVVEFGGVTARVISGELGGVQGPAPARLTEPLILDISVARGGDAYLFIPDGHRAFAYVYDGSAELGPPGMSQTVPTKACAVLSDEGPLRAAGEAGARLLLIAGKPLREPVARYGPFVMNTQAELMRAFEDYRSGRFVTN